MSMRRTLIGMMVSILLVLLGSHTGHAEPTSPPQMPNLVPLPPYDVSIDRSLRNPEGPPSLRFTTAIANRGNYSLDILGQVTDLGHARALQCVAWTAQYLCTERLDRTRLQWHPEHQHFHIDNFAEYELRKLLSSGKPNFSRGALVSSSRKVSFCLMDSEVDDSNRGGPYGLIGNPLYGACSASAQGISPGWRDVYNAGTLGQELSLHRVSSGRYALLITVNPSSELLELRTRDNSSGVKIEIDVKSATVTTVCDFDPDWSCHAT